MPSVGKKPFENIVGKGENAGNQHFLAMISTISKKNWILRGTSQLSTVVCNFSQFEKVDIFVE